MVAIVVLLVLQVPPPEAVKVIVPPGHILPPDTAATGLTVNVLVT